MNKLFSTIIMLIIVSASFSLIRSVLFYGLDLSFIECVFLLLPSFLFGFLFYKKQEFDYWLACILAEILFTLAKFIGYSL